MVTQNKTDIKHEDLIMKKAMELFAQEGLKFFGIHKKVKEAGTTEIVVLETKNLHMDYTFLLEDDTYLHFEFQTTNKGKDDLRRFRVYESMLSMQTKRDVVTYVIYSGNIKNPLSRIVTGINEYNTVPISMAYKNGDEVFENIQSKINNGEQVTKEDLIALTFTPIMGGTLSRADKIIKSIRIVKDVESEYKNDVQSMLYAFADKFLSKSDLERVKEEISMTRLGEMLMEYGRKQGLKEGIMEGIREGRLKDAENLLRLGVSEDIISQATEIPLEKVKEMRKKILN